MKSYKTAYIGEFGEDLAARYFTALNCTIITRNYQCCYGEIDLIVMDGEELVMIEVKTRSGSIAETENSVSRAKQRKIILSALSFIVDNPEFDDISLRFDVILVGRKNRYRNTEIRHIKDAFSPDYDLSFE